MAVDLILPLILGIIFGGVFFLIDIYNENKTREINTSLIAGITITYFFIVLLPEINTGLEELPLEIYRFTGILIGFSTIHITEKLILLRVEQKSQIKLKDLHKEEAEIVEKEKSVEKSLLLKLIENDDNDSIEENLVEKLFALEEINKIQEIWIKEEEKYRYKLLNSKPEKKFYIKVLSSLREISKIQKICTEEETIIENSLMKSILNFSEKGPSFDKLNKKLEKIKDIRQKQRENVDKGEFLITYLMRSLMADKRDKISKEEFLEKLKILEETHALLGKFFLDEIGLLKVKFEDKFVHKSGKRASKNIYALEVLGKILDVCMEGEEKLEKELLEIGHDKLTLLAKLSAFKEISRIRTKCVKEEDNLEKKIVKDYNDIFTETNIVKKLKSITEISKHREEYLIKEKIILDSLIEKLMKDEKDYHLTVIEFNEQLSELVELRRIQVETVKQEKNLENYVFFYISHDENERLTLQDLAAKLDKFCQREEELEEESQNLKVRIQNRINEHLDSLHKYTNFGYHLLIGVILIQLLMHELSTAILFFVFAMFKALTSKTSNDIQLFPGIEISEEYHEPLYLKILFASAALIGVFIGFYISTVMHVPLVIIFLLFSFISGVILYTIIREVLPENESGRPLYFLLGILLFLIVIITFESVISLFDAPHH